MVFVLERDEDKLLFYKNCKYKELLDLIIEQKDKIPEVVASHNSKISRIFITPSNAKPAPGVIEAIENADVVSFNSVILAGFEADAFSIYAVVDGKLTNQHKNESEKDITKYDYALY